MGQKMAKPAHQLTMISRFGRCLANASIAIIQKIISLWVSLIALLISIVLMPVKLCARSVRTCLGFHCEFYPNNKQGVVDDVNCRNYTLYLSVRDFAVRPSLKLRAKRMIGNSYNVLKSIVNR